MKDSGGDRARLRHILDAISEIDSYTEATDIEEFSKNSMKKYATIKQLEIIGEAANHISDDLKQTNANIEWREIIGLRNILIHEYFGIDERVIWDIINIDLPKLKQQIKRILSEF